MSESTHSSVHNEFERVESRKWRPILVGFLGTVIFHFLLFLFIPETLMILVSAEPKQQSWQEFDIILAEDEPEIMKQYVPVNKMDVSNEPDETDYFASQNSQAANTEIPEDLNEDTPFIEGEAEEFNNLVQGQLNRSTPSPPVPPTQASDTQPREQQNPSMPQIRINRPLGEDEIEQQRSRIPVALEDEALDVDSPRSFPELPDQPEDKDAEEVVDNEQDAKEDSTRLDEGVVQDQTPMVPPEEGSPQSNPQDTPARLPQPRVQIANSGPLKHSMEGVSRLAQMANYSAEFSEFGEYLERMFETIEIEWNNLLAQQRLAERRSRVSIAFLLNEDGEIVDWEIVQATSSLQAQIVCAAAINNRAPFGDWTNEMRSTLKDPERIIVNFLYY